SLFELVEAHVLALRRADEADGHLHEAETDRAGPNGTGHSIDSRYGDERPGHRDRRPRAEDLESRQGPLSGGRVPQGRRHRLLPSHRTVAAPPPCGTAADLGAGAGRPSRTTLLREELPLPPSAGAAGLRWSRGDRRDERLSRRGGAVIGLARQPRG